jgi:hypothetical protein
MSKYQFIDTDDIETLALNPKVLRNATLKDSRDTKKEKKHWKRNIKPNVKKKKKILNKPAKTFRIQLFRFQTFNPW